VCKTDLLHDVRHAVEATLPEPSRRSRDDSVMDMNLNNYIYHLNVWPTYYREELRDVDDSRIISQPLNRGTGVAVAVALLHILQYDSDAVVILVPCDHYYSDVEACRRGHQRGYIWCRAISGFDRPRGCHGPLPGSRLWMDRTQLNHFTRVIPLLQVNRFWEKPSLLQAQALLRRGCLWNTFVTVGQARAFLDLVCSQIPEVVLSLNKARAENDLSVAYRLMPAVDFSRQVLSPQPNRLLAVPDVSSGWADLGSPSRVMDILARNKLQPAWLRDGNGHPKAIG
jgi:mannose-1-phosphate guanylyltransferase